MSTVRQQLADGKRDQLHITAIKVIQLKEHGIQSLVKVETDGGVYGLGEIGAPAAVARAPAKLNFPGPAAVGLPSRTATGDERVRIGPFKGPLAARPKEPLMI